MPTDKILIQNSDPRIPLFNLEEFKFRKFEGAYDCSEDKVKVFAQWIPRDIPDLDKCTQHSNNYAIIAN